MTSQPGVSARRSTLALVVAAGLLGTVLVWSYWTTLAEVAGRWNYDPQYSHGFLVPGFAVVLLWLRRKRLESGALRFSAWGLPLLVAAIAMRLYGACFHFAWLDQMSLLPCLAGLIALVGGWPALRWSWPAVAFL